MVPTKIARYLHSAGVPFAVRPHRRAVSAQKLAASVHVSGYRVAKSVLVEADGKPMMAVLPAADVVDVERLAASVGALTLRMMSEDEFSSLFSGAELGAEPPLGSLYGVPVVVDYRLTHSRTFIIRGGSHEDAIEMRYEDFARLEKPLVADFAVLEQAPPRYSDVWLDS